MAIVLGAGNIDSQELPRHALRAFICMAIDEAQAKQQFVAVLMIILTRPDRLDDILGVPRAEITRQALQRLSDALREADRYVQVADDKLCIVLPQLKSATQAWLAAGKIQRVLEPYFQFGHEQVYVRPTIGIACYPEHADTAEDLILRADIAKRAAHASDIGTHMFQREDQRDTEIYRGLDAALRSALKTNELMVHYQPQINLHTGACDAVEALLRWNLPEYGAIPPAIAVRVAEGSGLIGALTHWVLNTVLRQLAELNRKGIKLTMSVNLSTVTLADADLPDIIEHALQTWEIAPTDLTLEITESSTIVDADRSLAMLERFKRIGTRLSVDDFGTGYSSLSYLKRYPLDELKIDKLFVQHMRQTKGDQQIVRSVIDLSHNFELRAVAEGVEDRETLEELRAMGCDLAQGYVISRAMPMDQLLIWLKANPVSR